jgi:hypothetical protein
MNEIFPNHVPSYLDHPIRTVYPDGTIQKEYLDGVITLVDGEDSETETLFPDGGVHLEAATDSNNSGPLYVEDGHDHAGFCDN